jgi:hypothetical protein
MIAFMGGTLFYLVVYLAFCDNIRVNKIVVVINEGMGVVLTL